VSGLWALFRRRRGAAAKLAAAKPDWIYLQVARPPRKIRLSHLFRFWTKRRRKNLHLTRPRPHSTYAYFYEPLVALVCMAIVELQAQISCVFASIGKLTTGPVKLNAQGTSTASIMSRAVPKVEVFLPSIHSQHSANTVYRL
jgi:hypothetical protein